MIIPMSSFQQKASHNLEWGGKNMWGAGLTRGRIRSKTSGLSSVVGVRSSSVHSDHGPALPESCSRVWFPGFLGMEQNESSRSISRNVATLFLFDTNELASLIALFVLFCLLFSSLLLNF